MESKLHELNCHLLLFPCTDTVEPYYQTMEDDGYILDGLTLDEVIRIINKRATSGPNPDMITWDKMVEACSSVEIFRTVIDDMFRDERYTRCRLKVLEHYMTEVGKTYPEISSEIREVYSNFVSELEEKLYGQCNYCTLI